MRLSATIKEIHLKDFFSTIGTVREVLIEPESLINQKLIAFVEFECSYLVPLALGLNNKKLMGVPIIITSHLPERTYYPKTLYVSPLRNSVTKDMLRIVFEPFGQIDLMNTVKNGRDRIGFITFSKPENAKKALDKMNGFELAGIKVSVNLAWKRTGEGNTTNSFTFNTNELGSAGSGLEVQATTLNRTTIENMSATPTANMLDPATHMDEEFIVDQTDDLYVDELLDTSHQIGDSGGFKEIGSKDSEISRSRDKRSSPSRIWDRSRWSSTHHLPTPLPPLGSPSSSHLDKEFTVELTDDLYVDEPLETSLNISHSGGLKENGSKDSEMLSTPDVLMENKDLRTVCCIRLAKGITTTDLHRFFSPVGKVTDIKIQTDGIVKGSVRFESFHSVPLALCLNGHRLMGVPIIVQPTKQTCLTRALIQRMYDEKKVFVSLIPNSVTEDSVRKMFDKYGQMNLTYAERHECTSSCFITYNKAEDAKKSIRHMDGFEIVGERIRVIHVWRKIGCDLQVPTALPPAANSATPFIAQRTACFMLSNMFDPATETNPSWDIEIRDDVIEECNKHGGVLHVFVDKSSPMGIVYCKCTTIPAAFATIKALHGRWFAGKLVTAAYVPVVTYHANFPEAANAVALLQLSEQSLNT